MNTQEFALGQRIITSQHLTRHGNQHGVVVDYGYQMTYNRDTGRMQRRYDYAVILDDGTAFRLAGKWLTTEDEERAA